MADEAAGTEAPEAPAEVTLQESEGKTFSSDYVKSLRSENAAARKARQELEARLTELEDRDKSEVQKLTGKLSKIEQERDEYRKALIRYEVANEKNVPAKLVPLLTGSTREEIEAQAALILETAKPVDPDFDGGPREPAEPAKPPEEAHNDFFLKLMSAS
jgi:hypothetical protein